MKKETDGNGNGNGKSVGPEVFQLWKTRLEAYFRAQQMIQAHGEKMLDILLTQAEAWQAEKNYLMHNWFGSLKKANTEYQQNLEQNLKKSEEYFRKFL